MNLTYKFILTLFCCSQSILFASPAQENQDLRLLELGKPIERELTGGQTHTYQITLAADQCLQAVLDQRGIDVVITIFDPAGKLLLEIDGPNGDKGPEPIAVIAAEAGVFRVEVKSLEKTAALGRYEMKVIEVRNATQLDRSRFEADQALMEVDQSKGQKKVEALRKAVNKMETILPLLRAAGEKENEARTLFLLGQCYGSLNENQKAADAYIQSIAQYRSIGERKYEPFTLLQLSAQYKNLAYPQQSINFLLEALPQARARNNRSFEVEILRRIGMDYSQLGEYQIAIDYYMQALKVVREIGKLNERSIFSNSQLLFSVFSSIGDMYFQLGEDQKAMEFYKQAEAIIPQATISSFSRSSLFHNIADLYGSSKDYQQAITYFNLALPLARETRNELLEAGVLNGIGKCYWRLGDKQKAMDFMNQAIAIAVASSNPNSHYSIFRDQGWLYQEMGDIPKAIETLTKALSMARAYAKGYSGGAGMLSILADLQSKLGNLAEARENIEEAIKLSERTRNRLSGQGFRSSYSSAIYERYKLYEDVLIQLHKKKPSEGLDLLALQANEQGRARALLDLLVAGRANIAQGIEPTLLKREADLRESINKKSEEQMRLANVKDSKDKAATLEKEIRQLILEHELVEAQIQATNPHYAAIVQPQPLTVKEIQQQVLDPDTLLLEYSLGAERSYLWVASQSSLNHFVLPKAAEIDKAARRVYELLTAPNQVIKGETPEQQIARLARAETDYAAAAADLSRLILSPAADLLGKKRLLVVTDGALQYIPFSALPAPTNAAQPLALTNEIVFLPSASALAVLRRELAGRPSANKAVAVLADPVFSRDDSRLTSPGKVQSVQPVQPEETATSRTRDLERAAKDSGLSGEGFRIPRLLYSRREAEAIATAAKGTAFKALDFDASRAVATSSDLSQYRIVHFATHGLLNSEHPELSGIVLSLVNRQGEPQNGFLRLQDVFNLRLNAELVVLSACQTGLGKEIKGEGLIGLTRGFMYAGAARVLASLWKVDDAATAELMKRFYGKILTTKMRPAAALREAQMEMWQQKRWRSPYFWAAFTLQGEWR